MPMTDYREKQTKCAEK